MHPEARRYISEWTRNRTFSHVLEFGSLDINGSVRDLFALTDDYAGAHSYHGIDLQDGPGVDEVRDAAHYLAARPVDVVVCCEMLEHAEDRPAILRSAWANLRHGGLFLVTCATDPRASHSAVDGGALRPTEYYSNVHPEDLIYGCEKVGFVVQHHEVSLLRGDLYLRAKKP